MIVTRVREFATKAHSGQVRKYTGEPYINHPKEVADIVSSVTDDRNMIAAAWLHDVVEDCGISIEEIRTVFGDDVCYLVESLTDVSTKSDGNRAARKAIDRAHIARSSVRAKTIKLADLISNTSSIVNHDPEFAKVYLREKRMLLDVMQDADKTLLSMALEIIGQ